MNQKKTKQSFFLNKKLFICVLFLLILFLIISLTTIQVLNKDDYYEEERLISDKEEIETKEWNLIENIIYLNFFKYSKLFKNQIIFKFLNDVELKFDDISYNLSKENQLNNSINETYLSLVNSNIDYSKELLVNKINFNSLKNELNCWLKSSKVKFCGNFKLNLNSTKHIGSFELKSRSVLLNWTTSILKNEKMNLFLDNIEVKTFLEPHETVVSIKLLDEKSNTTSLRLTSLLKSYLSKYLTQILNNEYKNLINDLYLSKNSLFELKVNSTLNNENGFKLGSILQKLIQLRPYLSTQINHFLEHYLKMYSTKKMKISFYNQDIDQILLTNLSEINNLKIKYFTSLKNHLEDDRDHLEPFLKLFEEQVKEKFDDNLGFFTTSLFELINDAIIKSHHVDNLNDEINLNENLNLSQVKDDVEVNTNLTETDDENLDENVNNQENNENEEIFNRRNKRQVPCQRGQELDEYVDSLFKFASRLIRAMEPIALPNATIDLPELNMKLFLHHGGVSRAYTLQRKRQAWVYCANESVSLGITAGVEELRIKYKYRAIQDWHLLWDGELEAKLEHPKLQIQFTQTTPEEDSEVPVMQRLDRIRIWRLGHVRVLLKGLGNLTQGVSMILTKMINQNLDTLGPTLRHLESEVLNIGNVLLRNVSIPFFSVI